MTAEPPRERSLFLPAGWDRRPPADHGLHGPDSVTWRVFGTPAVGLGAARAALVQLLYPPVAAGIGQHSDYLSDLHGRAARTLEFAYATAYGDTEIVDHVRTVFARVHERIRGIEPVSGQPYAADDVEHLRYVHTTGWHSILVAHRALGGRMTPEEVSRFMAEGVVAATTAGLAPDEVPGTRAEVSDYLASMRPRLAVSVQARALIEGLLRTSGTGVPGVLGRLGGALGIAGAALMPRHLQRLAGIDRHPWLDRCVVLPAATGLLRVAAADPADRWLHLMTPTGASLRRRALDSAPTG